MAIPTLLRQAEHEALRGITLDGKVVDLGGDRRSDYHSYIQGEYEVTTVDMNEKALPDVKHNLEEALPFPDTSFDHALLINVLEHIYNYQQLLSEAARIVRPSGSVIIVVPFLFPIHPSPRDFWRFSAEALERECARAGLSVESLTPLGRGVLSARYMLLDRLMPSFLRTLGFYVVRPFVVACDFLLVSLARRLSKKYDPADYALGYLLSARKA